jgi:hypothetical protein
LVPTRFHYKPKSNTTNYNFGSRFSFFFDTGFFLFNPRVAVADLGGGRFFLQLAVNLAVQFEIAVWLRPAKHMNSNNK